jgi:NIMA (never in mitosis gene a)-related kinase
LNNTVSFNRINIGEGAYSTVFRVKRISDGSEYAMKKVKMVKLSERER